MYTSTYLDPNNDVLSLQCKVQFDIRFYFACRVCENMEKMTKHTFKFGFNCNINLSYVYKAEDELTKNHQSIDEKVSGFMPENRDDPLCPVKSFRKYLEHLNPDNNFLWQVALENVDIKTTQVWFSKKHMGKNTLALFMQDISKECHLSKKYTNHSIRVTATTVLTRQNFSASEIMSITCHKSVQSLTRYQRTQDKQKMRMGNVMHQSMTRSEDEIEVPGRKILAKPNILELQYDVSITSPQKAVAPANFPKDIHQNEFSNKPLVLYEPTFDRDELPDFDLVSILNEIENSQTTQAPKSNTAMMSNQVVNNIPKSLFHNCTIQNIMFNMKN